MGGHIFVYVSILDDHKIILVMPSYALLPSHSRIWGEQWKTNFLPVQKVLLLYIYDSGSFPTFIVNLNVIARIIFTNSRISLTDLSTLLWVVMDACIINCTSHYGETPGRKPSVPLQCTRLILDTICPPQPYLVSPVPPAHFFSESTAINNWNRSHPFMSQACACISLLPSDIYMAWS